jgi:glycosyltransferase involved in cell wall biosynthesis
MKISFAITVCNELEEIKKLVPFLLENKRIQDEIVVLYDNENGNPEILEFLLPFNKLPNVQTWRGLGWNNNFAEWKNKLNEYCDGDYIFQLDADEIIDINFVKSIGEVIELNPEVDVYYLPRVNTVDGLTNEHVNKWGWRVNENGWVNSPDYQGRIYRKNMSRSGKVHERIVGAKMYSLLPMNEPTYFISHHKTITRQEKQNNFYSTI